MYSIVNKWKFNSLLIKAASSVTHTPITTFKYTYLNCLHVAFTKHSTPQISSTSSYYVYTCNKLRNSLYPGNKNLYLSLSLVTNISSLLFTCKTSSFTSCKISSVGDWTFQPPTIQPPTVQPSTIQPPTFQPPTIQPPTFQPPLKADLPRLYCNG